MELKNRILEIIEKSGLTPSEFADKIEVQRSAISHITSGRNKPSLEFLIKIKAAFPEIDTDWLVFGIEKEEEKIDPQSVVPKTQHLAPTLFDELSESKMAENESGNGKKDYNPESKKIKHIIFIYEDGTFHDFTRN